MDEGTRYCEPCLHGDGSGCYCGNAPRELVGIDRLRTLDGWARHERTLERFGLGRTRDEVQS